MQRFIKRLSAMLIFSLLLLLFCTASFAAEYPSTSPSALEGLPKDIQEIMIAQSEPIRINNIMMEEFMTEDGEFIYPDNYAGTYVDYDKLVIQLTDISDEATAYYYNLVGYDAPVLFEQVAYAYHQLEKIGEEYIRTNNVSAMIYYVDTKVNRYHIGLNKDNAESTQTIEQFDQRLGIETYGMPLPIDIELEEPINWMIPEENKTAIDPSVLEEPMVEAAGMPDVLYPGSGIHVYPPNIIGSENGSVGISGLYEGRYALLTCGHLFAKFSHLGNSAYIPVYSSNDYEQIGTANTIVHPRYVKSGLRPITTVTGDWAIVLIDPEDVQDLSNNIYYGSTNIPITPIGNVTFGGAPIGTLVTGSGRYTTTYFGSVDAVNVNVTDETTGAGYGGMEKYTKSIASLVSGDSGGPIYYWDSNSGVYTLLSTLTADNANYFFGSPYRWPGLSGFSFTPNI